MTVRKLNEGYVAVRPLKTDKAKETQKALSQRKNDKAIIRGVSERIIPYCTTSEGKNTPARRVLVSAYGFV